MTIDVIIEAMFSFGFLLLYLQSKELVVALYGIVTAIRCILIWKKQKKQ